MPWAVRPRRRSPFRSPDTGCQRRARFLVLSDRSTARGLDRLDAGRAVAAHPGQNNATERVGDPFGGAFHRHVDRRPHAVDPLAVVESQTEAAADVARNLEVGVSRCDRGLAGREPIAIRGFGDVVRAPSVESLGEAGRKVGGMCWTTSTFASRSAGSRSNSRSTIFGPPVDAPRTIVGASASHRRRRSVRPLRRWRT